MSRYILDTNSFDYLLDNSIEIDELKSKGQFYTTNVQYSELTNIPDQKEKRRVQLLNIYNSLEQQKLPLRSGIWVDELRWDDEQPWIDDFSDEFKVLKGSTNQNNRDALIADIAIANKLTVVTSDTGFRAKCEANNIPYLSIEKLLRK